MTKKQTAMFNNWKNATKTTLSECYVKPSAAKRHAFWECRKECANTRGQDFRVVSYNAQFFVVAWIYPDSDGDYRMHYDTGRTVYDFLIG